MNSRNTAIQFFSVSTIKYLPCRGLPLAYCVVSRTNHFRQTPALNSRGAAFNPLHAGHRIGPVPRSKGLLARRRLPSKLLATATVLFAQIPGQRDTFRLPYSYPLGESPPCRPQEQCSWGQEQGTSLLRALAPPLTPL